MSIENKLGSDGNYIYGKMNNETIIKEYTGINSNTANITINKDTRTIQSNVIKTPKILTFMRANEIYKQFDGSSDVKIDSEDYLLTYINNKIDITKEEITTLVTILSRNYGNSSMALLFDLVTGKPIIETNGKNYYLAYEKINRTLTAEEAASGFDIEDNEQITITDEVPNINITAAVGDFVLIFNPTTDIQIFLPNGYGWNGGAGPIFEAGRIYQISSINNTVYADNGRLI